MPVRITPDVGQDSPGTCPACAEDDCCGCALRCVLDAGHPGMHTTVYSWTDDTIKEDTQHDKPA